MAAQRNSGVRRIEVIATLSLAIGQAMGQSSDFGLKSCIMAMRLASTLNLPQEEKVEVFYQSLLRFLGCNADTQGMANLLGDEIAFRQDFATIDPAKPGELLPLLISHIDGAKSDQEFLARIVAVAGGLLSSRKISVENLSGHCEVAQRLAERLGLSENVRRNLGQLYERWDGKGMPHGLKGDAISRPVRIVALVQDAIALTESFGADLAAGKLLARRGKAYEPALLNLFLQNRARLFDGIDNWSWDDVLALDPDTRSPLSESELDEACLAMADFSDLKSPYSLGHSRAVAALATSSAKRMNLPVQDIKLLWRAGLLHDLGQVGISVRIWAKPSPFNDREWEQVRLHAYYGERVLSRAKGLSPLASVIGEHHERLDGSGYHRATKAQSIAGRLLAAAEAYQNKIEERPHRPALSTAAAALALREEVRKGSLDGGCVAAVLASAGHVMKVRPENLAGLTPREIEVLRLIGKGQSMKDMARSLGLTPKTVDNHTQNIYAKIGVRTRGAAILYAIEHGICRSD